MTNDKKVLKFLTFKIGKEVYGVDISNSKEIIKYTPYQLMLAPHEDILGFFKYRTDIITLLSPTIISKTKFFNKEEDSKILILENESEYLGILVDEMVGLVTVESVDVKECPRQIKSNKIIGLINDGTEITIILNVAEICKQIK